MRGCPMAASVQSKFNIRICATTQRGPQNHLGRCGARKIFLPEFKFAWLEREFHDNLPLELGAYFLCCCVLFA